LVVMSIIPFGLIGTIYGHYVWSVPISMFSIVGLIGMSGIIINDSIVLVTTIDEYAEKRGTRPAIIDAACDRLRPVLLTTLTTVLGLLPLLFESSRQALFLKPTVITLCYGLGFGVVLVMLVVPALVVVQQDIGGLIASARRATFGGKLPAKYRAITTTSGAVAGVLVAIVFGTLFVTNTAVSWFSFFAPTLHTTAPVMASLMVVVIGLMVILAAAFTALALTARKQTG